MLKVLVLKLRCIFPYVLQSHKTLCALKVAAALVSLDEPNETLGGSLWDSKSDNKSKL